MRSRRSTSSSASPSAVPGPRPRSIALDIYKTAFSDSRFGYGTAKSVVLFLLILVVTVTQLNAFKRREVRHEDDRRGGPLLSLVMAVFALVYLYPLILVAINSLKTFAEIMANVVALPAAEWRELPKRVHPHGYPNLFLNTLMVTCLGTAAASCSWLLLPGTSSRARRPATAGSSSSCAWRQ